ncbi:hypothetical protein ACFQZ4_07100 [Catellatospora coxensis]
MPDIEQARAELVARGVAVSEVFHDANALVYHGHGGGDITHDGPGQGRVTGRHPERADYGSFATFSDPDGNGWVLQEVRMRAPAADTVRRRRRAAGAGTRPAARPGTRGARPLSAMIGRTGADSIRSDPQEQQ